MRVSLGGSESREANFLLYYLREPPGRPPNTSFNEAIQNTSRKFAGPWPKGVLRSRGLVLYVLVDLPLPPPQGAFSAVVGRR